MVTSLFYPLIAGFIGGTLLGPLMPAPVFIAGSFIGAVLFLFILGCLGWVYENNSRTRYAPLFLIVVAAGSCILGIGAFFIARQAHGDMELQKNIGATVALEGIVSDEPSESGTSLRVEVSVIKIGTTTLAHPTSILFSIPSYTSIQYGDEIEARGTLGKPQSFRGDTGSVFHYDTYLQAQHIFYILNAPAFSIVGHNKGNPIKRELFFIKDTFVKKLSATIPFPESRLAAGLTVAGKQALPKSILDDFTRSGTIQVVVLSGYNVTIVAELIGWLTSFITIFLSPRFFSAAVSSSISGLAGIVAIIGFCIMAGASSTIIRGAIMASAVIAAKLFRRQYDVHRAFWFSAFLMLIFNPLLAAYDPSFQYSFLATAGLLYASDIFSEMYYFVPERFGLRATASATTATQAMVVPLALYSTGQISWAALPANLLLFLITPLTMALCFICACLGFISPLVAVPVAWPAFLLLAYQLTLVHLFALIPFVFWTIPAFPFWAMLASYGCYAVYGWYRHVEQRSTRVSSKR